MASWIPIASWWLAFSASHLVLSSVGVRRPLIARLGERGFQGLYSLVALVTFVPFVWAWWGARHDGPLLWSLRDVAGLRELAIALSVLGFVLVFMGAMQPSPVSITGGDRRVRGALRITRHGVFMGIGLWALAHVLVNGWATDVAFFGGLALFAVVGSLHQDARKQALDDGSLAAFYRETSVLPFAAILSGRNRLVPGELSWPAVALGAAAGIALFLFHGSLFR